MVKFYCYFGFFIILGCDEFVIWIVFSDFIKVLLVQVNSMFVVVVVSGVVFVVGEFCVIIWLYDWV